MYFGSNIRLLRLRKNRTQEVVSNELDISRSTLNSYENSSIKNPTLDALFMFSKYFHISIDTLVKIDLSKLGEGKLNELERGSDVYITGSKLRVIATTVDVENNETIEVVSHRAKAGYKSGYADPEYIKRLPAFQLPILYNDRKYRMFQINGDSMLPVPDKSWVIGEYVDNWYDIKDGQAYIVFTIDDGIVFKIVKNHLRKKRILELISLNDEYAPYEVPATEVKEVWKFCNYISNELPDPAMQKNALLSRIGAIASVVAELKTSLK
jgi:transcriptional regulator with XRE-family HTH domain